MGPGFCCINSLLISVTALICINCTLQHTDFRTHILLCNYEGKEAAAKTMVFNLETKNQELWYPTPTPERDRESSWEKAGVTLLQWILSQLHLGLNKRSSGMRTHHAPSHYQCPPKKCVMHLGLNTHHQMHKVTWKFKKESYCLDASSYIKKKFGLVDFPFLLPHPLINSHPIC